MMALAASDSDASNPNAKTHSTGQTGQPGSKVTTIHRHARGTKAHSAARKGSLFRMDHHRVGPQLSNRGTGTVLYDQTANYDGYGVGATQFGSASSSASLLSLSSAAADDFVVGAGGWTVTGFNFLTFNYYGTLVDNIADVYVYPDASGVPAVAPVCSSVGSTNNPTDNGDGTTLAGITLNAPCALAAGTYWVSVAFQNTGGLFGNWPYSWGLVTGTNNSEGVYRQPDGGGVCTDWGAISTCFDVSAIDPPPTGYSYQVLGTTGGGGGSDLELSLTLALDNGTLAQCGTSTNLSVVVGDQVNFCYTVTNHTGVDLSYQTLADTLGGTLFSLTQEDLPDGGSIQFNRIVTAGTSNNGTVTATWTSQDGTPGYGFDDTGTSNFVDISATGTALNLADDSAADVTMPFSFPFYGTTTNQLTIGNNGAINVGSPGSSVTYSNTALPGLIDSTNPLPSILPLWDDFYTFNPGQVYYATLGTAPNRQFVIEYDAQLHFDGAPDNTDSATFEVIIDEATGNFSFEYSDVEYTANGAFGGGDPAVCDGGLCATVGVQQDGTIANQYSFMTASLHDGQSIAWSPSVINNLFTATASATLDVGAPVISVNPGTLSATVDAGSTSTATLTIGNTGNRDLNWNIDEAPSTGNVRAHFPAMPYHAPPMTAEQHQKLSGKRSTILRGKDGKPLFTNFGSVHPSGVAQVPSYGGGNDGNYYSFDAAAPDPFTTVGPIGGDYIGGSFANNDFSKEYLIGYSTGGFASIDTTTGALTVINPDPGTGFGCGALRWDASTSTMYGICADGSGPTSYLYSVDLGTGAFTQVGESDGIFLVSAAFDQSGNMYGLDIAGDQLVAIDKTTGDYQAIGPIGFNANYAQDIDFDPSTGVLWYAGYDKYNLGYMYTLDTTTGTASPVAPFPNGTEISAFSVAVPSGGCATPEDVPWLSVAPASGTTAGGASTPTTVTFDATGLAGGVYDANLCVHSNDASNRLVAVPVELTVGGGDTIFKDGFDGSGGGNPNIVDSGVVNLDMTDSFDGLYLNWITGTAGPTFNFNPYDNSTTPGDGGGLTFFWPNNAAGEGGASTDGVSYDVLTAGAVIGPSTQFIAATSGADYTNWRGGVDGNLGFTFDCSSLGGSASVCYGYAHLTTTAPAGYPGTVVEWWFDNTGAPITVQ
jgi:hypothetical protein